MLPYRIRPEAEADLNEIYWWYERRREGLGADFLLCFEEALEKTRRHHDLYPLVHKTARRAWMRRFPYGLFYTVEEETVIVIGVFHARRDPHCWQSR
ncbi:MAG: type II toxin-antitoxin system RelE/ParE family toxin [Planctomycetes bacterium]|nr:type II toxin-antitoxin system RelE/ParE family toxin [Planctomycetota bacterium]MCG2683840.1 type II toxin-antitoxin system RelE/ParE family toxin [Planctomycetales bacterium]